MIRMAKSGCARTTATRHCVRSLSVVTELAAPAVSGPMHVAGGARLVLPRDHPQTNLT